MDPISDFFPLFFSTADPFDSLPLSKTMIRETWQVAHFHFLSAIIWSIAMIVTNIYIYIFGC